MKKLLACVLTLLMLMGVFTLGTIAQSAAQQQLGRLHDQIIDEIWEDRGEALRTASNALLFIAWHNLDPMYTLADDADPEAASLAWQAIEAIREQYCEAVCAFHMLVFESDDATVLAALADGSAEAVLREMVSLDLQEHQARAAWLQDFMMPQARYFGAKFDYLHFIYTLSKYPGNRLGVADLDAFRSAIEAMYEEFFREHDIINDMARAGQWDELLERITIHYNTVNALIEDHGGTLPGWLTVVVNWLLFFFAFGWIWM